VKLTRADAGIQNRYYVFQARLKPGVTIAQATADLDAVAHNVAKTYPQDYPPKFNVIVVRWVDSIVGEFKGFSNGKQYTLANGQVWEQIEPASLAGVRKTDPEVSIKPGLFNNWFMQIKGYNTAAKVRRVK
jgi:hypothetical protein